MPTIVYFIKSSEGPAFSIFEGKMTLIFDNDANKPTKMMLVYTLYNNTNDFAISSSKLVEEKSGFDISSGNILFNNTTPFTFKTRPQSVPQVITISIRYDQPGVYHGSFFIEGKAR